MSSKHGLSKTEVREALATIWKQLIEGDDEVDIADDLGLDLDVFQNFKRRLIDKKAQDASGKAVEHVFVEYMLQQLGNVHELTELIVELKEYSEGKGDLAKVASARVAAVKARSSIYDSILTKGQDTGVFKREPSKVVGGFVLADMATPELRAIVVEAVANLGTMMRTYGSHGLKEMRIERDSLHHGPALPPAPEEGGEIIEVEVTTSAPKSRRGKGKKNRNSSKSRGRRRRKEED